MYLYFTSIPSHIIDRFVLNFFSNVATLSFHERFLEGKMQDTSCAFYKIQQTLVKNPGVLSQEEVIYFWFSIILDCSKPLSHWGIGDGGTIQ